MGDSAEAGEGLLFLLDVGLGAPGSVLDYVDAGFGWDAVEADVAEDVAGAGMFGREGFAWLNEAGVEDVFGDGEEVGDAPLGLVVEEEEAGIGACSNLLHLDAVSRVDDGA